MQKHWRGLFLAVLVLALFLVTFGQSGLTAFWDWIAKDSISFFTAVLAVFTGALVVVAVIEIGYLKKADKVSRELADIASRQMLIQGSQTDILEKQKEISRIQYFATHRPVLVARYSRLTGAEETSSQPIQVRFAVVNKGDSDALITSAYAVLQFLHTDSRLLPVPTYLGRDQLQEPFQTAFGPGHSEDLIVVGTALGSSIKQERGMGREIYISGFITYVDGMRNNARTMAFCRRYNKARDRFETTGDDDWEYSD
jgi:hypothetical protein